MRAKTIVNKNVTTYSLPRTGAGCCLKNRASYIDTKLKRK